MTETRSQGVQRHIVYRIDDVSYTNDPQVFQGISICPMNVRWYFKLEFRYLLKLTFDWL